MVFTMQKARAGSNPESPQKTQPETNIREVRTPSWTFFKQEQNELSVQQVVKYYQEKEVNDCIIMFLVLMILQYRIV